MIEFFKLIGRDSAEIGVQRKEERNSQQGRAGAGLPLGRPACTTCTCAARLTARSTVARRTVDRSGRPTGILGFLLVPVDQRIRSVDRQANRSPVRIRTLFLIWRQFQL